MSKFITIHRMVHAVESLTFAMYEGERPPTNQDEADQMFHEHEDDWNSRSAMDEIVDYDVPHGYTSFNEEVDGILQTEHYVSLEEE